MSSKSKTVARKDSIPTTIDEYIANFPPEVRKRLEQVRTTIRKAAPQATEVISYRMPAFRLNSVLVYFAGCEEHIGFNPTPNAIMAFRKELAGYSSSKGAVQFPLDEPLPVALIAKIVKFRVQEDSARAEGQHKR